MSSSNLVCSYSRKCGKLVDLSKSQIPFNAECLFGHNLEITHVNTYFSLNMMALVVSMCEKIVRYFVYTYFLLINEDIAVLLTELILDAILDFGPFECDEKMTPFFLKAYDVFFQNQVRFCLYQKKTRNYKWAYTINTVADFCHFVSWCRRRHEMAKISHHT